MATLAGLGLARKDSRSGPALGPVRAIRLSVCASLPPSVRAACSGDWAEVLDRPLGQTPVGATACRFAFEQIEGPDQRPQVWRRPGRAIAAEQMVRAEGILVRTDSPRAP